MPWSSVGLNSLPSCSSSRVQQCKGRGWKLGRDLAVKLKTVTGTPGSSDTIDFPPSIKEIWQMHARHICREDSNVLLLLCPECRWVFLSVVASMNQWIQHSSKCRGDKSVPVWSYWWKDPGELDGGDSMGFILIPVREVLCWDGDELLHRAFSNCWCFP